MIAKWPGMVHTYSYSPSLGMVSFRVSFWPGSMVVVGESGPPELIEVLTDVDREVLAGRAGGSS